MPELPEVETTLRGIAPHIKNAVVTKVKVRNNRLRWPIPDQLETKLKEQPLLDLKRRSKYLLFTFPKGTLIVHLGMSGSLRILCDKTPAEKHEHFDLCFDTGTLLRYRDPRRFGAILWTEAPLCEHPLLKSLGPEPFSTVFSGEYLWKQARGKKQAIKSFIMDAKQVVGVGNIYANESLFYAGIRPSRPANKVSKADFEQLAKTIIEVLTQAIAQGGTTLKDFTSGSGQPGYFQQALAVYGREGKACTHCGTILKSIRIGQRASCYCPQCQK